MNDNKLDLTVTPSHTEPVPKEVKGVYEGVTVEIKENKVNVLSRRFPGDYSSVKGISVAFLKKVIEGYENCK